MKYFDKFIYWLESLGFDVLQAGGTCPWQLCLNHDSGYSIYCRSRHSQFDFEVFSCPMEFDLPDDSMLVHTSSFHNWVDPAAGYIETQTAWQCFQACYADARDKGAIADE